jgi:hypothetical protein
MTYQTEINQLISKRKYKIPFTTSYFAGTKAISRISNGQTRPTRFWHEANKKYEDQIKLRTLSWCGWLLGWHIDHIVPSEKGGSYNVKNLRLLPPSLNAMIGSSGGWDHDKMNRFIEHLGPEWRKELGIPEGFKSCSPLEFFKAVDLSDLEVQDG